MDSERLGGSRESLWRERQGVISVPSYEREGVASRRQGQGLVACS